MYSRFFLCFALLVATAAAAPLDSARIEQLTGLKGSFNPAKDVFKVTYPRGDIGAKVEGRALAPFMGFTSWAAFKAGGKAEAMVMGDLVLTGEEVNPVMKKFLENGIEITALHNHLLRAEIKFHRRQPRLCARW